MRNGKGSVSRASAVRARDRMKIASRAKMPVGSALKAAVLYFDDTDLDLFIASAWTATSAQLVEAARVCASRRFVKEISRRLKIPETRLFEIIGVPKSPAERRVGDNTVIKGAPARAALGMAKLLGMAKAIVDDSTAPEARNFDFAEWLGQWMECSQPALDGRMPAVLMDTPVGIEAVTRVLGSICSGAYQ